MKEKNLQPPIESSNDVSSSNRERDKYTPLYGDLTELNTTRVVLDAVGSDMLAAITAEYLDILGTSGAVYEADGDYALGIFSSGWCRRLDQASRELCGTEDNQPALKSGRWLCHESCWRHASKIAVDTGREVDVICHGGIRIFALPIVAGDRIVGSANFGYGNPPRENQALQEISNKYQIDVEELYRLARTYRARPPELIEMAKANLRTAVRLIGALVQQKQTQEALRKSEERHRLFTENFTGIAYRVEALTFRPLLFQGTVENITGYEAREFTDGRIAWDKLVIDEDRTKLYAGGERLSRIEGHVENTIYRIKRKDGAERWVRDVARSVTEPSSGKLIIYGAIDDITDFRRTEESLVRAHQEWERIFQAIGHPTLILDPQYRIIKANHAASFVAADAQIEDLQGKRCYEIFHNDATPPDICPLTRLLQTGTAAETEIEMEAINRNFLVSCTPVTDARGNLEKVIHIATDITKRKQTENALRAGESRYRAVVETHNDAICRWRPDTTLTFTNKRYREIFGIETQESAHECQWLEFIPQAERAATAEKYRQLAINPKKISYEHNVTVANGDIRWFDWTDVPLFDQSGKLVEFQSVGRDITERKLTEIKLINNHLLLEAVTRAQSMMIGDREPKSVFESMLNDVLKLTESQYGFIGEVLYTGQNQPFLKTHALTDISWNEETRALYQEHAAQGLEFHNLNTLFGEVLKTDRFIISNDPSDDPRGGGLPPGHPPLNAFLGLPMVSRKQVIGMIGIANRSGGYNESQVVYLKPLLAAGAMFIETMRNNLKQKELEIQFHQAQKMESVGRLAGGVAHDFNNLLSVILGYTDMLLVDLPSNHPNRETLVEVRTAGQRAESLTRQLLAFARKQVFEIKSLDLNEIVTAFEKMLRRFIGEDIELVLHLLDKPLPVGGDVAQLEQVLMNLAVNARDAMPNGGILTLKTDIVELDRAYTKDKTDFIPGRYVMLTVSDTGMGMTPEVREKIFEPFFTTKDRDKGTGLGLSTVYGIIKQHGGNIWMYSEHQQGTTFKIYLPYETTLPTKKLEDQPQAEPEPGSAVVLVVEDEAVVRRLVCAILAQNGYTVIESTSVQDAIEKAARHPGSVDLVFTDVVMPGMNGPELYQRVLEHQPKARVLYISGYTESTILQTGALKDDIHFIAKPFSVNELLAKTSKVLKAAP